MLRKRNVAILFGVYFILAILNGMVFGAEICGHPEMGAIEISRSGKPIEQFGVTLAISAESQRLGLMNCPSLSPRSGMLFTYPDARRRVFWMKNTLIDLAIIFISAEGRIAAIEHGEPGSTYPIRSPEGIQSVLEINFHESHHLMVGDGVRLRLSAS
jgi:uncharacterized membrane protein (UPF0127 family)